MRALRRVCLPLHRLLRAGALAALVGFAGALAFILWPLPDGFLERGSGVTQRIHDREGGLLRELRAGDEGRRLPLPPGELPPKVRQAFLAAEDRRFESHLGVDPRAIGRALLQNLRAGRVVSGASTLTQQLARRLVPRERTLWGKAQEALWALRLERHLSKEAILRAYLDQVPLGRSVVGVETAAQLYFGRPAARLSTGQAALLAGMARSPARLDPYRHPARSLQRRDWVLERMRRLGMIDAEEARAARAAALDLVPPAATFQAPHFTAGLVARLPALGLSAAARIETTLDPALQRDVEAIVAEEIRALAEKQASHAAAVVVDNESGEILAYVGSADFFDEARGGQNDGVRALRQPGSALKPFAYGLALASGFTPATLLSDLDVEVGTPTGTWTPRNYDRRVHGPVRLRVALASSYNIPSVEVAERLGVERFLELLQRAGFDSLEREPAHYGAGLVLGNGDVQAWELARAFRGLARGGVVGPLRELRGAWDEAGRPLALPAEAGFEAGERRFLPEGAAALLTAILADEGSRTPAFGIDNALRLPFPVAAKTGTSRAFVDNWTAGYTAERSVVVWVGNFDGKPMRDVSGISGAGPIFRRVMLRAMEGIRPAPLVDEGRFEHASICSLSGQAVGPACPHRVEEVFLPGSAPKEPCGMHRRGPAGGVVLDPGPRFAEWARTEGWRLAEGREGGQASGALLLPRDGDEYLLDPGLAPEDQSIPLRALPPAGHEELEIRFEDGRRLRLRAPFTTRLPVVQGSHRVELWVPGGDAPLAHARFRVH